MEQKNRIQPQMGSSTCAGRGEPNCPTPDVVVYPSLAMVYPPRQVWRNLYDADNGFCRGTIYRELDKPFSPEKC